MIDPATAISDAVKALRRAAENLGHHTTRLRGLGLLHHNVAEGDWD